MRRLNVWKQLNPYFQFAGLGYLPDILLAEDKRPIKDQLNERYAHGGGWRPMKGLTMLPNKTLRYPGDPPYRPAASAQFGDETVIYYPQGSLLAVIQPDGSWEVSRVD